MEQLILALIRRLNLLTWLGFIIMMQTTFFVVLTFISVSQKFDHVQIGHIVLDSFAAATFLSIVAVITFLVLWFNRNDFG